MYTTAKFKTIEVTNFNNVNNSALMQLLEFAKKNTSQSFAAYNTLIARLYNYEVSRLVFLFNKQGVYVGLYALAGNYDIPIALDDYLDLEVIHEKLEEVRKDNRNEFEAVPLPLAHISENKVGQLYVDFEFDSEEEMPDEDSGILTQIIAEELPVLEEKVERQAKAQGALEALSYLYGFKIKQWMSDKVIEYSNTEGSFDDWVMYLADITKEINTQNE